jgi:hypothetical protein
MYSMWLHILWVLAMKPSDLSEGKEPGQLCETCTRVKQIYGSTDQVAPWLCSCNQKTAQSSLPVARHRSNPPTIAAAIAESRLALAIKARRA